MFLRVGTWKDIILFQSASLQESLSSNTWLFQKKSFSEAIKMLISMLENKLFYQFYPVGRRRQLCKYTMKTNVHLSVSQSFHWSLHRHDQRIPTTMNFSFHQICILSFIFISSIFLLHNNVLFASVFQIRCFVLRSQKLHVIHKTCFFFEKKNLLVRFP